MFVFRPRRFSCSYVAVMVLAFLLRVHGRRNRKAFGSEDVLFPSDYCAVQSPLFYSNIDNLPEVPDPNAAQSFISKPFGHQLKVKRGSNSLSHLFGFVSFPLSLSLFWYPFEMGEPTERLKPRCTKPWGPGGYLG